jgi:hypothetical protein
MNNNLESLFGTRMEMFLGIALVLGLLLPHTSTMFLLVNPLLCIIFLLQKGKTFCRYGIAPIAAILISLLINAAGAASGKSMLTAISILLCLSAFPMVSGTKLKDVYIYLCFGFILLSQVAYMFHLGFIASFFDTVYPITWGENFITIANENATLDNYLDFRLGGLYRNPNHCAKYVTFLMAIFIANNAKEKTIREQVIFLTLCYFSVIMTGSRTGFLISSILILMALFRNQKTPSVMKAFVIALVVGLMIYNYMSGGAGRGAGIEAGFHGSADMKWLLLMDYLSHETSIIYYLFGHLDLQLFNPALNVNYSFDAEYGYIIYCFGFVGLFAFIYYLYKLYKHLDKTNRVFFVVVLWMITSSIFMAYRAVFVFMLLLSTIYKTTNAK